MDIKNLHTLKWVSTHADIKLSTLYKRIRFGKINVYNIDGIRVIDISTLPNELKKNIDYETQEKKS